MRKALFVFVALFISLSALAADSPSAISAFAAGSNWTGTETGDPRRPNTIQAGAKAASFSVRELKDSAFTATIKIGSDSLELKGRLSAKGMIQAQPVKILHGTTWDPHILELMWTGAVQNDQLQLSYTNSHNLTRTIALTLDTAEVDSGKKKKK